MLKIQKTNFFSSNLVKKRNFFVNLLILSSLAFVFLKNSDKIRYTYVTSEQGDVYILDRFASSIELVEK